VNSEQGGLPLIVASNPTFSSTTNLYWLFSQILMLHFLHCLRHLPDGQIIIYTLADEVKVN
jgi:hypothetical protein